MLPKLKKHLMQSAFVTVTGLGQLLAPAAASAAVRPLDLRAPGVEVSGFEPALGGTLASLSDAVSRAAPSAAPAEARLRPSLGWQAQPTRAGGAAIQDIAPPDTAQVARLARLLERLAANGSIDKGEVQRLFREARRGGVSLEKLEFLEGARRTYQHQLRPDVAAHFDQELAQVVPPPFAPRYAEAIRVLVGSNPASLEDDELFIGRDTLRESSTGIQPYTRGWGATSVGPFRMRHGSPAPASTVLAPQALTELRGRSPGASLDRAAEVFGVRVNSFEALANSSNFYRADAVDWEGKCHAWAWAALHPWLNEKVDVPGLAGERGLWIGGEWISRADLGTWLMGVADRISLARGELFADRLTPEQLLKSVGQYLFERPVGFIGDIHLDARKGNREIWNQPFVEARVARRPLSRTAERALVNLAREQGQARAAHAQLLAVTGHYASEPESSSAGDNHEEAPIIAQRNWNLYAVLDGEGKVVKAYMAYDDALKKLQLPTHTSDDLLEYTWLPNLQPVEDALAGRPNATIDSDALGPHFRFFIQTVLDKGVSAATRAGFERDLWQQPPGALGAEAVARLAQAYPGVANAYSPAQWAEHFAARGLSAESFGAAWLPAQGAPVAESHRR
jgi:hypothetical protein